MILFNFSIKQKNENAFTVKRNGMSFKVEFQKTYRAGNIRRYGFQIKFPKELESMTYGEIFYDVETDTYTMKGKIEKWDDNANHIVPLCFRMMDITEITESQLEEKVNNEFVELW